MFNWVPTMYMGKPEIPVRKSNGSRYSVRTVRQGSENNLSAVICGDAIFFKIFLGFSAHLDVTCSQPFSHHVKFHSFMFMNKIPTRLVCVNGKPSL